jgi:MerR family transcriptional regulator, redox-sensitive transcriptional activator SoxR
MQPNNSLLLSITRVSQRSGVPASALRYYESLGLIESVRGGTGHRHYHRSTLRRLAFIVFAQKIGYNLEEVAELLGRLPKGRVPTGEDWWDLSREWKKRVEERIAELEQLNHSLDECIGCGCLSVEKCRLSNPEDCSNRNGPGARRWLGDAPPSWVDNDGGRN